MTAASSSRGSADGATGERVSSSSSSVVAPGAGPALIRTERGSPARGRRQPVGECRVEHDPLRAALGEDEGELRPLLADVHRDRDRAEPQHREQRVDELAVVREVQHDAVAARDAEPVEVPRQPVGDPVQLGVVQPVPVGDQCLALAVSRDGVGERARSGSAVARRSSASPGRSGSRRGARGRRSSAWRGIVLRLAG